MTHPAPDTQRRKVLGGIAGGLVLGLHAANTRAAPAGKPIRIGSTLSLTGPLAQTALLHRIAGESYIDIANAGNGLLGRPVEWVLLDDQSKPEVTRSLYEKLITSDKVDLVVGPYGTNSILAAMGVAQRHGKIFIQGSLGIPKLGTYDMQFPAAPFGPNPEKDYPLAILDCVQSLPSPPKSVTVITSKFPSAQFMAEGMREAARQRKLQVPLYLEYEFGTRDFASIAARVKDANADFLWVGALGVEGNQLLEALKKLDYAPKLHYYLYPSPGPLLALPEAKNALAHTFFEDHPPFSNRDGVPKLSPMYRARASKAGVQYTQLDAQATGTYNVFSLLGHAVEATKSLDDKTLAQWLKKNTVDGVFGPQSFDGPFNHGPGRMLTKQVQNGKWVVVWPREVAGAPLVAS
ncbi:amino acid ABC transporter substrate-binding protein [Variovorax sp. WS11]|uniref:amino acid ABC transporter substrate-binding protein n=1 Tax=Variovorax sp. WS11 TaxID=1105204 RepID=UPI0013DB686D|nr:amino acid ABC transporter substrate-binding protein [Variovorax sp. WS11]NDZ17481.1 ABC transporter substrate-binding protein [Variovorax sp. WS11]